MTFKKINDYKILKNKILNEYEHIETGAKHYHVVEDGGENTFLISFKTPVENDKGITHILEHMVFNGSEKYPVSGLFEKISGRNFEKMMNAGTGATSTSFYFTTSLQEGFLNLTDIYMDMVLRPLLTEQTFLQEGVRFDLDENGNLVYSGIVFNEMMGYVGQANMMATSKLRKLFSKNPEFVYQGGDPIELTNVTHEEIVDFHKKYYTASNADILTVGDIPIEVLHEKLEQNLAGLKKTNKVVLPPAEFIHKNKTVKTTHANEDYTNIEAIIDLGDLDSDTRKMLSYISPVLSEKLKQYLATNKINLNLKYAFFTKISENNVFRTSFSSKDNSVIENFKEIFQNAISFILADEIPVEVLVNQKINFLASMNDPKKDKYSLSIISKIYNTLTKNESFEFLIQDTKYVENLSKSLEETNLFKSLIKTFLDKKEMSLIISDYDPKYIENYNKQIKDKEKIINEKYSKSEKEDLAFRIKKLSSEVVEKDVLIPEVVLNKDIKIPELNIDDCYIEEIELNNAKIKLFDDFESNKASIILSKNMKNLTEKELMFESIINNLLHHSNIKGLDENKSNIWKNDGIASYSFTFDKNIFKENTYLKKVIALKGYKNNIKTLIDKAFEIDNIQDLTDKEKFLKNIENSLDGFKRVSINEVASYLRMYSTHSLQEDALNYIDHIQVLRLMEKIISDMKSGDFKSYDELVNYYYSPERKNQNIFEVKLHINKDDKNLVLEQLKYKNLGLRDTLTEKEVLDIVNYQENLNKNIVLIGDTSSEIAVLSVGTDLDLFNPVECTKLEILTTYLAQVSLNKIRVEDGAYGSFVYTAHKDIKMLAYQTPDSASALSYYKDLANEVKEKGINSDIYTNVLKEKIAEYLNYSTKEQKFAILNEDGYVDYKDWREKSISTILNMTEEDLLKVLDKYLIGNKNLKTAVFTSEDRIIYNENTEYIEYPLQKICTERIKKERSLKLEEKKI